jgi:hypothetical protein
MDVIILFALDVLVQLVLLAANVLTRGKQN